MFSHLLGIRPWETEQLTARQFDQCVAYLDDLNSPAPSAESEDVDYG